MWTGPDLERPFKVTQTVDPESKLMADYNEIVVMCLFEVGYAHLIVDHPSIPGLKMANVRELPRPILTRAARLACEHLGVPIMFTDEEEMQFMTETYQ